MESLALPTPRAGRKLDAEEKSQMLQNFDLEVEMKRQQFEEWLADQLESFRIRQEGKILHIPRLVRDVTLRDFAKYRGDIQECLKGLQRERLGGEVGAIDRTTRKRKWIESQETEVVKETDVSTSEGSKGMKSARMMTATPKKAGPSNVPGTGQRSRLPLTKTPSTMRTRPPIREPSPSPHKPSLAGANGRPFAFPRLGPGSRPTSPVKPLISPSKPTRPASPSKAHPPQVRVPSSSTFNPTLPETTQLRWPRKDENMLSVNGSPLANPYRLGFSFGFAGWLADADEDDDETRPGQNTINTPGKAHRRTNSIIVRSLSGTSSNHLRSDSQASIAPTTGTHSRTNSNNNGFIPLRKTPPSTSQDPQTPRNQGPTPSAAALVAVPTKDGHVLEFDPLQTSPDEIDSLEGITDSAKKQAKEDIARLVLKAVERWKIT
ncbi:unnamed protein product [Somion occarium]|uniref:Borealin N-terminal domain-containing protein n=1 Tax=Somion occarium TaxID=3059160 RepID=A0ABP1E105_9APHY